MVNNVSVMLISEVLITVMLKPLWHYCCEKLSCYMHTILKFGV